jgi:hypothetical protein
MTDTAGAAVKINGKTVCWQYRKGKCRFGHNCKFAHDSDILPADSDNFQGGHPRKKFDPIGSKNAMEGAKSVSSGSGPVINSEMGDDEDALPAQSVTFSSGAKLSGDNNHPSKRKVSSGDFSDEEASEDKKSGKKKRPGLASNLVPGKKVMNMYYKSKTN